MESFTEAMEAFMKAVDASTEAFMSFHAKPKFCRRQEGPGGQGAAIDGTVEGEKSRVAMFIHSWFSAG